MSSHGCDVISLSPFLIVSASLIQQKQPSSYSNTHAPLLKNFQCFILHSGHDQTYKSPLSSSFYPIAPYIPYLQTPPLNQPSLTIFDREKTLNIVGLNVFQNYGTRIYLLNKKIFLWWIIAQCLFTTSRAIKMNLGTCLCPHYPQQLETNSHIFFQCTHTQLYLHYLARKLDLELHASILTHATNLIDIIDSQLSKNPLATMRLAITHRLLGTLASP